MRVFVSWSGAKSHAVANALREWLPEVLQSVVPFVSSESIYAGNRWQADIAAELQASGFGVICVTGDNQDAAWLNFEAGALSKVVEASRVAPLAIDLATTDIKQPLGQFQAQPANEEGVRKIVVSINEASGSQLSEKAVNKAFDRCWPDLDKRLQEIAQAHPDEGPGHQRSERELLEEILGGVRGLVRSPRRPPEPEIDLRSIYMFLDKELNDLQEISLATDRSTVTVSTTSLPKISRQAALNRWADKRGLTLEFVEYVEDGNGEGDDEG